MKSSFDQQIKQQLEQSSPEDLGYKPDRDKLWNRIEAKQNRKRVPIRMWLSHAAAIAAGLIIGSYFLTTYRQDPAQQDIKQTEQPTATTVVPRQDSLQTAVLHGQHSPLPATAQAKPNRSQHTPVPQPTAQQQPEPVVAAQQQSEQDNLPADKTAEQPVVAQATRPKVKVLHLMDMHNENTKLIQAEPIQPDTRWAWLLPEQTEKSGTESFSAQVVKHILHPKNN